MLQALLGLEDLHYHFCPTLASQFVTGKLTGTAGRGEQRRRGCGLAGWGCRPGACHRREPPVEREPNGDCDRLESTSSSICTIYCVAIE